jgi:hypothetical protein
MTAQLDHIDSTKDKRNDAEMFEDVGPEKPIPTAEKYDRFGAHEKTDPKEIALVKKLDRWIMVRPGSHAVRFTSVN